jgi:hypothetical protein
VADPVQAGENQFAVAMGEPEDLKTGRGVHIDTSPSRVGGTESCREVELTSSELSELGGSCITGP